MKAWRLIVEKQDALARDRRLHEINGLDLALLEPIGMPQKPDCRTIEECDLSTAEISELATELESQGRQIAELCQSVGKIDSGSAKSVSDPEVGGAVGSAGEGQQGVRVTRHARAASRSQLDTLALQLALNGVEGDLKRKCRKPRPADDGGASKYQEGRHLNSPQMACNEDGRDVQRGSGRQYFLGLMRRYAPHRAASDDTPARQPRTRTAATPTKI